MKLFPIILIALFLILSSQDLQLKEIQMGQFKNNDLEIYYEIHGEGEPLLLIAGLASDSQSWLPILPQLSKEYKVIVFDNRTVGRTKSSDEKITVSLMSQDAVGLLDHLNIERVNIVGHSMGGFIALDLAATYPDRVKKLIIAAAPLKISQRNKKLFQDWCSYLDEGMSEDLWFRNLFYWILTEDFFNNDEVLRAALNYSINYPYPQTKEGFRKQINSINDFSPEIQAAKIKTKTLIIAAEKDLLFLPAQCKQLADSMQNSTFEIIRNAAHSIHSEKPDIFAALIRNFLRNKDSN